MSVSTLTEKFYQWEQAARDSIDVKRIYIDMTAYPGKPETADLASGVMLSQIVWHFLPAYYDNGNAIWKNTLRDHEGFFWLTRSRSDWWTECRITSRQTDRIIARLSDGKEGSRPVEGLHLLVREIHKVHNTPTIHLRLNFPVFLAKWEAVIEGRPIPQFEVVDNTLKAVDTLRKLPPTNGREVDTIGGGGGYHWQGLPPTNVQSLTLYKDQEDQKGERGKIEQSYNPDGDLMREDLELTEELNKLWERLIGSEMGKLPDLTVCRAVSYEVLKANRLVAFWTSRGRSRSDLPLTAIMLNVEVSYSKLDRLNMARKGLEDHLSGMALKFNLLADKEQRDRPYPSTAFLIRFEDEDRRLAIDGGARDPLPSPLPRKLQPNRALNPTGAKELPY